MKRFIQRMILAAALLMPAVAVASPSMIPVQGTLYDATGRPVSGTLPVTYTLYADPDGVTTLWADAIPTLFTNGIFTTYLGSESPLNLVLFRDYETVWVGIAIDGDAEIGRFRVATAPFAAYADFCGTAAVLSADGSTSVVNATIATADGRYAPLSHRTPWATIDGIPTDLADGDRVLTEAEVDAFVSNNGYQLTSDSLAWSRLTGIPADLADGDRVLTEAEVDAFVSDNGYQLTSDSLAWSRLTGIPADLADGARVLTEAEVDDFVSDNGFVTTAVGDSRYALVSHRLPWTTIDGIPADLADGDRVLTEAEVDAFANNNGYLSQAVADGRYAAASHSQPWSSLTGVPAGFADGVDDTVNEAQVDAWAGNNGYVTQDNGDLRYARASHTQAWSTITSVPAGFADGVDDVLTEAQVDAFANNNNYAPRGLTLSTRNCTRTPSSGYVNNFDAPVNFACPSGQVLVGTDSIHDNGTEDRRYAFTCCEIFIPN